MLTLSLESHHREPGTICRSLICKDNHRHNRSHPTPGNDSTRERFLSAPALDLIVPTRSIVPSREPGNRERLRTTSPRQNGSFLRKKQYGGRERGISPPSGPETGLPPEVTGYHPPTMQTMAAGANRKPLQTLFLVRTVAKRRARAPRMGHGEEGPLLPRAVTRPAKR